MAHDFNNLLCTAMLNVDMLDEAVAHTADAGSLSEFRAPELLQRARAAAERGAELIAQLRAFADKHPILRQPPDQAEAVRLAAVAMPASPGATMALDDGGGTVTRLLLPLAPDPVTRALAEPAPLVRAGEPPPGSALAGLRVLLVEDDPEVREATELLLQDDGAIVVTAENAFAALALLESDMAFDLLLSDVVLPGGLSGIDVVEAAAADLRPDLPALLASGYVAPAQELGRSLPFGVILLRKPYRHIDLLDAIASTLNPASRRHRTAA
jgi:CheY-like chemotaxis protein